MYRTVLYRGIPSSKRKIRVDSGFFFGRRGNIRRNYFVFSVCLLVKNTRIPPIKSKFYSARRKTRTWNVGGSPHIQLSHHQPPINHRSPQPALDEHCCRFSFLCSYNPTYSHIQFYLITDPRSNSRNIKSWL